MLTIDIQRDSDEPSPAEADLEAAVMAALDVAGHATAQRGEAKEEELSVRIVNAQEMQALNRRYRHRDRPTNVLSFPSEMPADLPFRHLGDIVVCAAVVADEAREQQKPPAAHWAHMLVHGTLHLLGHDHENPEEADIMEDLETRALASLGWPCPYDTAVAEHRKRVENTVDSKVEVAG
jgi:probable rRNA maturation factor